MGWRSMHWSISTGMCGSMSALVYAATLQLGFKNQWRAGSWGFAESFIATCLVLSFTALVVIVSSAGQQLLIPQVKTGCVWFQGNKLHSWLFGFGLVLAPQWVTHAQVCNSGAGVGKHTQSSLEGKEIPAQGWPNVVPGCHGWGCCSWQAQAELSGWIASFHGCEERLVTTTLFFSSPWSPSPLLSSPLFSPTARSCCAMCWALLHSFNTAGKCMGHMKPWLGFLRVGDLSSFKGGCTVLWEIWRIFHPV